MRGEQEMEKGEAAAAVCGKEALELLNCVADSSSFDQHKCIHLINSLRKCVLEKKVKKFSLAKDEKQSKPGDVGQKQG